MVSVPFTFGCDRSSGFVMDPHEHKRVGYITDFEGLGASLAKDLTISLPYTGQAHVYQGIALVQNQKQTTAHVVGVLESFVWEGSVGAPLKFGFYVSKENATHIKTLQQKALKTTTINQLGWWILDYDQETKQWFEAAYPQSSKAVTGIVANRDNPELNVDLTPVPAKEGVDVMVYKVSVAVVPEANQQYTLAFANSSARRVTKSWGLVIGKLASNQIKPEV